MKKNKLKSIYLEYSIYMIVLLLLYTLFHSIAMRIPKNNIWEWGCYFLIYMYCYVTIIRYFKRLLNAEEELKVGDVVSLDNGRIDLLFQGQVYINNKEFELNNFYIIGEIKNDTAKIVNHKGQIAILEKTQLKKQ